MKNWNKKNGFVYLAFTIAGLLFLAVAQDLSWAGICLALALVFSPFGATAFKDLSFSQKSLILGQMATGMLLIIAHFAQTVVG
ncbi:MAG: hypothetical protein AAFZ63_16255 [Bacteroidota bacterium]